MKRAGARIRARALGDIQEHSGKVGIQLRGCSKPAKGPASAAPRARTILLVIFGIANGLLAAPVLIIAPRSEAAHLECGAALLIIVRAMLVEALQ
jgi:hypothetical protein